MYNADYHNWISRVHPKHGVLHRQLGYKEGEHIPTPVLKDIVITPIGAHAHGVMVTRLLKQRANFALNVRK